MCGPTRTAREYPTTGSHGVPLEIFMRGISFVSPCVHGDAIAYGFDSRVPSLILRRSTGFSTHCLHLRLHKQLAAALQLCQSLHRVKPRARSRVSKRVKARPRLTKVTCNRAQAEISNANGPVTGNTRRPHDSRRSSAAEVVPGTGGAALCRRDWDS